MMLLHRPELYEPGQHEGIIEVIIAKQRNGPTGEITLTYLKQFMRFENFAVGTPFERLSGRLALSRGRPRLQSARRTLARGGSRMRVGIGHDTHRLAEGRPLHPRRRPRRASARPGRPQRRRRGAARRHRRPARRRRPRRHRRRLPRHRPALAATPTRRSSSRETLARLNRAGWRVVNVDVIDLRPGAEARPGQGGHPRQPRRAARPGDRRA